MATDPRHPVRAGVHGQELKNAARAQASSQDAMSLKRADLEVVGEQCAAAGGKNNDLSQRPTQST